MFGLTSRIIRHNDCDFKQLLHREVWLRIWIYSYSMVGQIGWVLARYVSSSHTRLPFHLSKTVVVTDRWVIETLVVSPLVDLQPLGCVLSTCSLVLIFVSSSWISENHGEKRILQINIVYFQTKQEMHTLSTHT